MSNDPDPQARGGGVGETGGGRPEGSVRRAWAKEQPGLSVAREEPLRVHELRKEVKTVVYWVLPRATTGALHPGQPLGQLAAPVPDHVLDTPAVKAQGGATRLVGCQSLWSS